MNEQDAINKFFYYARHNDLAACQEVVKYISIDTLNRQDSDDYDMLIEAVVAENTCAVIALLQDNRCDRTHVENLCGMTAWEYAMDYPENSPIRQAFAEAPMQDFVYRDGKVINRSDIFDRIMDDTLECDKGCFDMLPGDFYRAELVVNGKVSKDDFESWIIPEELHWEGQIALLTGDEEYGKKFVDWDYIRDAASASEWLSFLRDLPQYADKANWDKLFKEGHYRSWKALADARPEFQAKFQERNAYCKKIMTKYTHTTYFPPFNLAEACKRNDIEVVKFHLTVASPDLNKVYIYPMPPGFPATLPLAAAVKANAVACIELLLEHGADPDAPSCRYDDYKTPRELAADKPEILKLFNIYKGEKNS